MEHVNTDRTNDENSISDVSTVEDPTNDETAAPEASGKMTGDVSIFDSLSDSRATISMDKKEKWAFKLLRKWLQSVGRDLEPEKLLQTKSISELDHILAEFIVEIRQFNNGKRYQSESLRQFLMALQRYMRRHGRFVSFLTDQQFQMVQNSLAVESVENASESATSVERSHVSIIDPDVEALLWQKGVIGDHTPQALLDAQVFLFGIHFGMYSGLQHRHLRFADGPIQLMTDAEGREFIRFTLAVKKAPKLCKEHGRLAEEYVDVYEDRLHPERCLVRIYSFYVSKCPIDRPPDVYYLQPCSKPSPSCWYTTTPVGKNTLGSTMVRLSRAAGLSKNLSNQSLRYTCAIKLLEKGVDTGLVKRLTGLSPNDLEEYIDFHQGAALNGSAPSTSQEERFGVACLKRPASPCVAMVPCAKMARESNGFGTARHVDEAIAIPFKGDTEFVWSGKREDLDDCDWVGGLYIRVPVKSEAILGDLMPQRVIASAIEDSIYMSPGGWDPTSGEPRPYTGFVPDMMITIAKRMGVGYEFRHPQDGWYGARKEDGQWGGMIGDVYQGRAHMACGPLSITTEREQAVDFTFPYMTVGLVFLVKKPPAGTSLPFHDIPGLLDSGLKLCMPRGVACFEQMTRSKNRLVQQILGRILQSGRLAFVNSVEDGLKLAMEENYALLWDQTGIDVFSDTLVSVGPIFLPTFYGLCTPKGSPLCRTLGKVVKDLLEEGEIENLWNKWFQRKAPARAIDLT